MDENSVYLYFEQKILHTERIVKDISLDIQSLKIVNASNIWPKVQLFLGRLEIEYSGSRDWGTLVFEHGSVTYATADVFPPRRLATYPQSATERSIQCAFRRLAPRRSL